MNSNAEARKQKTRMHSVNSPCIVIRCCVCVCVCVCVRKREGDREWSENESERERARHTQTGITGMLRHESGKKLQKGKLRARRLY